MLKEALSRRLARRAEYWRTYRAVDAGTAPGAIVFVESKRLHQASFTVGLMRELPAVFTVLVAAASAVRGEHDAAGYSLAAAEVVAGAGVLVAIALEARHLFGREDEHADAAPHEGSPWDAPSLAAAALGYVEAWHHAHVVGHFKLWSPYTFGATVSLVVARYRGWSASKVRRRPHLLITPAGISYLAGPRRRWRAEWSEVAAVEHGHRELVVRLHDGRRHALRADEHLEGHGVLAKARAALAAHASHVSGAVSGATSAGPDSSARETASV